MKNKKKFAFLSIVLAASMLLGACNFTKNNKSTSSSGSSEDHPSSESSSSSSSSESSSDSDSSSSSESHPTVITHTVNFVVDGVTVQTSEVNDGELAFFNGEMPTKMPDANAIRYRFKGWDKDTTLPILEDTTFTAVFAAYVEEQVIDDFEDYEDSATMLDEGWMALGYNNTTGQWTTETKAAVSLGSNSVEGERSLRFDAWENGVGYKFAKALKDKAFPNSANALQFKLMVPGINALTVLLHAKVTIQGKEQAPVFKYRLTPSSSEYVEYTIPFDDDNWILWDNVGQSIKSVAEWTGIHQDDLVNYLTRIEFYVQGSDGGNGLPYAAFLDSAKFVTLDNPQIGQKENVRCFDRYTATLNNDHIIRFDINDNGSAVAKVIDLEEPITINGNVSVVDKDFTFTSSDNGQSITYHGQLANGGQIIKFISAEGALKDTIEDISLNSVQVVDNYEQYTEDGQAYYQGNLDKEQRSGARGAYYAEVYTNSGSSDWGGNGWSLLDGEGDQLKLVQDQAGAHSGKNYLSLKHYKSKAIRYMQWGLFDGSAEKNSFRGSKMGFWAKTEGAIKNATFYMYSQSSPTSATRTQYVKSNTFNISSETLTEWTHFEIDLNPAVVYYGFMVLIEKDYINDSTLFIDDVEIYSANPYAKYEIPEPEPEIDYSLVPGVVYNGKTGGMVRTQLNITSDTEAKLIVPGFSYEVDGTYSINERAITFTFGGTSCVLTSSEDKKQLKATSVTGSDVTAQVLSSVDFEMVAYGDNAETYEDDGTMYYQGNTNESARSGARGAYYCDYYTGGGSSPLGGTGWQLMGGNGDQLKLDKTTSAEGSKSLQIKYNKSFDMRYLSWDLYAGTGKGVTGMTKMKVWMKNPNNEDARVRVMAYAIQQVTAATQGAAYRAGDDITVPANSDWAEYSIDLDPTKTYYGHGFMMLKGGTLSTYYINVDYAHFVNEDNNPDVNYYAKKDVVISGNTTAGQATIIFLGNGRLSVTCEALGINDMEGTYSMSMDGAMQIMTITIGDSVVKGTFGVDLGGSVTFVTTETTGTLSTYIPNSTEFSN